MCDCRPDDCDGDPGRRRLDHQRGFASTRKGSGRRHRTRCLDNDQLLMRHRGDGTSGWLVTAALWRGALVPRCCSRIHRRLVAVRGRSVRTPHDSLPHPARCGRWVILPLAQAILLDIHPPERHGRVMAVWGAALMVGPILGPLLGGIITDLASWRAVFAINLPLGALVVALMRGLRDGSDRPAHTPIDVLSVLLLGIAIGALELTLERSVGRPWLQSLELASEGRVTILCLVLLALRSNKSGFSIFRLDVFKDIRFAAAAFYNFVTSALVFVAILFLPALAQGPLSYSATLAAFTIVPRAMLMTLVMLLVGRLIGRVSYRILLGAGWVLMATGPAILAHIESVHALAWMLTGSMVQAIGAGLLFTPHSTLAFSTLSPAQRTDAAGLYSLLRPLGFASGVALMSAVLRVRLDENLLASATAGSVPATEASVNAASLSAYADCFGMMALAAIAVSPGILIFGTTRSAEEKEAYRRHTTGVH